MAEHDYKAALEMLERDNAAGGYQHPTFAAAISALRHMASLQEAREKVERGEAVEVKAAVGFDPRDGRWRVVGHSATLEAHMRADVENTQFYCIGFIEAAVPVPLPFYVKATVSPVEGGE